MNPPDMSVVKRVLIIKMSALGDIVHALPVSAALGKAFPHLEISWIAEEPFAPLLVGNGYLREVLTLTKARGRAMRSMSLHREYFRRLAMVRRRRFDLTLDLQGLTKSALVAAVSGAPVRLGYHWLREAASLLEKRVPRRPDSVHIVDQYLDVARFLGASVERPEFPVSISAEEKETVNVLLREAGVPPHRPFVSINPASASAMKQWGSGSFAALIAEVRLRFGVSCALVTADRTVAAEVAGHATCDFADLSGRTSLKQLAAVIRSSAVHVCGDTGSGHLAAALGVPVVGLFGPTDVQRVGPYGQQENAIVHREVCGAACRNRKCAFDSARCLAAIGVDEVADRVGQLLASCVVRS